MISNKVLSCHKTDLIRLIREAKKVIFFATPGLSNDIADVLIDASLRLGRGNVIVLLDSNAQTERHGYGQIEAIENLLTKNIQVYHKFNFRIGFIRSDNYSLLYSPLSELLADNDPFKRTNNYFGENDRQASLFGDFNIYFEPIAFINAISLNSKDANEIIKALIPALGDKLKYWDEDIESTNPLSSAIDNDITEPTEIDESENYNTNLYTEFGTYELTFEDLEIAKKDLADNPPVPANIARKTRVLNSRFQFVEIEFKGAKLSNRQLTLKPKEMGLDPSQVGDNLSGVWKVLDRQVDEQIYPLEVKLKEIRSKYLHIIPGYGSIILCQDRQKFDKEMNELQNKVTNEMKKLETLIKNLLQESRERLMRLMITSLEVSYSKDKKWSNLPYEDVMKHIINNVEERLNKKYPTVDGILSKVGLDWKIFNISEQILEKDSFVLAIKEILRVDIEDLVRSEEAILFESKL